MKRYVFAIISLIISINLFSQNNVLHKNIVWEKNIILNNQEILSFKGADYDNKLIPYFVDAIDLESNNNADIKITNIVKEEIKLPQSYEMELSNDVKIKSNIYKARDRYILHYSFYPFLKENGKTYKIISFDINLTNKNRVVKKSISQKYANNSVLKSGKWVRIGIPQSGAYKLTYTQLKDLGFSNPQNVRVFGNDQGMLPEMNAEQVPDDLVENNILKGSDYIVFFAEGPSLWKYDSANDFFYLNKNIYSDTAYYFLTDYNTSFNNSIQNYSISGTPSATITTYKYLNHYESQLTNLLHSGRPFLGEVFDFTTSQNFSFTVNSPNSTQTSKIKVAMAARSSYSSKADIKIANNSNSLYFSPANGDLHRKYADYKSDIFDFNSNLEELNVNITYNKPTSSSKCWLDYITINAFANLSFTEQMQFRITENIGNGNITKVQITNANSNVEVWDVTNPTSPMKMQTSLSGTTLTFNTETDTIRHFIAFTVDNCPTPQLTGSKIGIIKNQNLHGISTNTEMIIITDSNFIDQAEQIKQIHQNHDNLNTVVVTTDQIYNEFSSGMKDISAIRNFIRMIYEKTSYKLAYVLLLGDGTYNNFAPTTEYNPNFIPTYQSKDYFNSLYNTFTSDNFFVLLDSDEGGITGDMDVSIGRFPAKSSDEAQILVDKLKEYYNPENFGDWHNIVTIFTDDRDASWETFTEDGETIANLIDSNYPFLNIKKIYADSYNQISSANGEEYPDAVIDLNNRINNGSLIVDYLGHGSEVALTAERIVTIHQINNWHNTGKYPLFITGTCEFSRFDETQPDHDATSAGELVLLNHIGGAIAMLTTSRVTYQGTNTYINQQFFQYLFAQQAGKYLTMGDAYRLAINQMTSNDKRFFVFLGDPAIRLAYPKNNIELTKINGTDIASFSDTLKALDRVEIEGNVKNINGETDENFQGILYFTYFDKKKEMFTLNNDGRGAMQYWNQFNQLFKGRAKVINGAFKLNYIIPKDIYYNFGLSKFSFYAVNDITDATGLNNNIILGGISNNPITDFTGPQIRLFMNDSNFVSGGMTNSNPSIFAILQDSSGINVSSASVGHDITAVIDNDPQQTYSLNEYYLADINNYMKGSLKYGLFNLEPGTHNIKLKAWDVYNNSSEKSIEFIVLENNDFTIKHLLNYPNPFTTKTSFYFEHNRPGVTLDVIIQIITVSGKVVKTIHTTINSDGFRSPAIDWDGLDDFGKPIGKGVYIYRLKIVTPTGETAEKFEKLLILK